jgi:hypothetical protein
VDQMYQIYLYGIWQIGIKDWSLIDTINLTFLTLTTTAIHNCQLPMKSAKLRVPLEFNPWGGEQHNCNTSSKTQADNNWRTDVFHCLDVHFRSFSPKVQPNNSHNIQHDSPLDTLN